MLRSKVFLKKTKRGKIVKIVREHYLRDDIWCGIEQCPGCQQQQNILESSPVSKSKLCPFPHYIVPDTNVVLHQVCRYVPIIALMQVVGTYYIVMMYYTWLACRL